MCWKLTVPAQVKFILLVFITLSPLLVTSISVSLLFFWPVVEAFFFCWDCYLPLHQWGHGNWCSSLLLHMKAYLRVYKSIGLLHLPLKLRGKGTLWLVWHQQYCITILNHFTYIFKCTPWVGEGIWSDSESGCVQPADQCSSMKENSQYF